MKLTRTVLVSLGFAVSGAIAACGQKLPSGGEVLITSEQSTTFHTGGDGVFKPPGPGEIEKTDYFEKSVVPVRDMPFTKAFRIQTLEYRGDTWGVELVAFAPKPVRRGDVLMLMFFLRGMDTRHESGEVFAVAVAQRHGPPWTKSLKVDCSAHTARGWKEYHYPFTCAEDYPAGKFMISFCLGFRHQTAQLGGIRLIHYGTKVKVEDLPVTESTYPGRAPDAPWRKPAAERIEKYRKANLTLTVAGSDGRPVAGAAVEINMQRHAFPFGTEVNPATLWTHTTEGRSWTAADAELYRSLIKKYFNAVTVGHYLGWRQWERPSVRHERDMGVKTVRWANENRLKVVGHCLVWPKAHSVPDDLRWLSKPGDYIHRRIVDHVADEAGALRGQMHAWVVLNEPHCVWAYRLFEVLAGREPPSENADWRDDWVETVGGIDRIADWFKTARRADPSAKLILNDSGVLTNRGTDVNRIAVSEKFYQRLFDLGAPVDAITEEAHFGKDLTDPAQVVKVLDRFARFGKEFWITEYDLMSPDLKLQADYLRDFLTVTFSHPTVGGFILWGFWESNHWQPSAALIRPDGTLKPAGRVWHDLIYRQWWTQVNGRTGPDGQFAVRGFLGDYTVAVTANGKIAAATTSLAKEGNTVRIVVK